MSDVKKSTATFSGGQKNILDDAPKSNDHIPPYDPLHHGKPRISLAPMRAIWEVVKVFTWAAATKHSPHSWRRGDESQVALVDKAYRHLYEYTVLKRDQDEQSGLSNLAHAAANCLMALEHATRGTNKDDRRDMDGTQV